ncbi:MAG TPA: MFS transporter [Bryobacteraceae bacterium]|nr:MFS transporter [Bryobacteraceae bacterium]
MSTYQLADLSRSTGSEARVAFQYPNFRLFMTARFLSVVSSEMISVAVGWQIYALTHRPLDLGLVGLAQFAPGVLLFLVAGHTADRHPRQAILRTCYCAFALCSIGLLVLTLHGVSNVLPIYAVLLANGTVRAFNAPAGQAFLPQLVKAEHFPNAVTWGSSFFQTATILGPVTGGLIYGFAGSPAPVYVCTTVAYSIAVGLIAAIRLKIIPRTAIARDAAVVLEGLHYIWRNKIILGCLSLDLFAVLLGGAVALLPVYASEILHIGPNGLGILRAAPGLGAVTVAILLAHYPMRRRVGMGMLWCVAGFGVFTIVFGVSHSIALSLVALILTGAFDMVSVIVRSSLVQLQTPDEMRGRVSSVNMLFIGASNEVGQFESGITAQWFGTVPSVILGGVGTILVVIAWNWLFPSLREVDQLTPDPVAKS